ncbi:shikimate kinase [Planctomonas sp. JC2975]|uniref:shikimate kinase n=1 Tax=Planctomonas sp. JC2975 TaxID=2729626 RepID=UPI0014759F70|nr:shikimate kinase [Planctomonas sp. JC2975]NNC12165.1 shikimate kinase [Planctomonas sp. JC2975]
MDLVFLHGPAAAGKLTVARALGERTGFAVFHNHLIVDAVTSVFPFGSARFVKLREQFWLSTFSEAAASDTSLIFTFTPEHTVLRGFPERARHVTEESGGRVRFVGLTVGEAEQERRLGNASRREFGKLTDVDTLRRLRRAERGAGDPAEQPPTDLVIDTERSDPEASALLIVDAFGLEPVTPHERYPEV